MRKMINARVLFHLVNLVSPLSVFIGFWYYDAMYGDRPSTALDRSLDSFFRIVAYGLAAGVGGLLWFLTSRYGKSRASLFLGSIVPITVITIVIGSFISEVIY